MTPRSVVQASALVLALLAFAPMAQPVMAQDAPLKIAVIDMDQVIAETDAGKDLREKLEAHSKQAQEDGTALEKNVTDLRKEIADGVDTLDQAQLVNLRRQLENAQRSLIGFGPAKQREAAAIQQESMVEIRKQVDPIFQAIQEESNYDLILNKQSGVVMMVGERVDITQTVIDRLK